MTTFLWIVIVLALAVGIAVVGGTQYCIWRRLDRMDEDQTRWAHRIISCEANEGLDADEISRLDKVARDLNRRMEILREVTEALTRKDPS